MPALLQIRYAPGTEPWLPPQAVLDQISAWLAGPATLEIHPRAALPAVWAREHGGRPLNRDPWSFRAWAVKAQRRVFFFVDETETPQSVLWGLLHELGHLDLTGAGVVQAAVIYPRTASYMDTDEGHEADPEEQLVNWAALHLLGKLGYEPRTYDRHWWRQRVCQLGRSRLHCPVRR